MIIDEVFDKVIALSELELEDDEKKTIKNDMEIMLGFFDVLREADIIDDFKGQDSTECGSVEDNSMEYDENIFREDVVTRDENNSVNNIIENVPKIEEGFIVVPKTVK